MAFDPTMLFAPLLSLFGAGVNASSADSVAESNLQAVRETNDLNKQLFYESYRLNKDVFDYQNAANVDFWNMQNEYNTPAQQMSRFAEAGLNPNLIYGQGNSGNAGAIQTGSFSVPKAPKMESYQAPVNMYSSAINGFFDNLMKLTQIQKTEQETKNLETQNDFAVLNVENMRLKNIFQGFVNSKTETEADMWFQRLKSEITRNEMQGANFESMINFRDYMGVSEAQSRIDLNKERRLSTIAERELIDYRKSLMSAQVTELISRASLNSARVELTDAQKSEVYEKINNLVLSENATYLENQIRAILFSSGVNLKGSAQNNLVNSILRFFQRNAEKDSPRSILDGYLPSQQ